MNTQVAVGPVLSRALDIYGRRLGLLLGMAAIVLIPTFLIAALLGEVGVIGSLLANVVQFAGTALYAGAVVRVVEAENAGSQPASIGEIFGSVGDRIWPLIWVGIIAGIATALGLLLLIIPGIFLLVIWAVFQPAIVVERIEFASLRRSRELVRGHGWSVLGVGLVLLLLVLVIGLGSVAIGGLIGGAAGAIVVGIALAVLLVPVDGLVRSVLYFALVASAADGGEPAGQAFGGDSQQPPPPPAD